MGLLELPCTTSRSVAWRKPVSSLSVSTTCSPCTAAMPYGARPGALFATSWLRKSDGPFGTKARTVGAESTRAGSNVTLNSWHCESGVATRYRSSTASPAGSRQEVLLELSTCMMSETGPVPTPFASSNDATNCVSAGKGRKVIAAPVRVTLSQLDVAISMDIGVRLKGTTVNTSGSDAGSLPPANFTEKLPHCWTAEKVIELNEWTTCGPKARSVLARARGTKVMAGPEGVRLEGARP